MPQDDSPQNVNSQVLGAHLLSEVSKCQGAPAAACTEVKWHEHPDIDLPTDSSPWQLYLEQLPRSYTNLCNWSASDINALQLSHAQEAAEATVELVKEQWRGICPLLKDIGGCRFEWIIHTFHPSTLRCHCVLSIV